MSVSRDSRRLSSRSVNERKAERGMHEKVQFNWVNYFSIDWVLLNRVLEMNFSWQMFRAMIQSVFLSAIAYAACMGRKQFHWSLLDAANEIGVIDHKMPTRLAFGTLFSSARCLRAGEKQQCSFHSGTCNVQSENSTPIDLFCFVIEFYYFWAEFWKHACPSKNVESCGRTRWKNEKSGKSMPGILIRKGRQTCHSAKFGWHSEDFG